MTGSNEIGAIQEILNRTQYDYRAFVREIEAQGIDRRTADEFRDDVMARLSMSGVNNGSPLACGWILAATGILLAAVGLPAYLFIVLIVPKVMALKP